ncbi:RNase III inhibitor [compost metagenome]
MRLIISAMTPALATALSDAFDTIPDVTIACCPFEDITDADCMVSAANSFGLMDGGVDAAITAYFGTQLQQRVQQCILDDYLGEQPVGTAFVIETGNSERYPYLVHAPTMRVPLIIDGTDAVYNATRAALLAIHHHNLKAPDDKKIRSVVFPAMGAGCGRVPPERVAAQMKLAWLNACQPAKSIDWRYATERQRTVVHASGSGVKPDWHTNIPTTPEAHCDCGCGWGGMGADAYGAAADPEHRYFGKHTHSINPPSSLGCHDHSYFINTGEHPHGVNKK